MKAKLVHRKILFKGWIQALLSLLNQSPGKNMYKIVIKDKPKGHTKEKDKINQDEFHEI